MSFDGIVTKSIVEELQFLLINGKINKINQPDKNCIIFNIYNKRMNYKLLIDASSNNPRINITNINRENPMVAPNFCMLLRKHIQGGIIENIKQIGIDRIINIDIKSMDELGDFTTKTLIVELMGKYSNIILVNKENNKIIDSIKRITLDISRIRQVLPGMNYELIKDNKFDITKSYEQPSTIIKKLEKPIKISRFFYSYYTGFSPQISKEICFRSNIDFDVKTSNLDNNNLKAIDENFENIVNSIINSDYDYLLYKKLDKYIDFHSIKLNHISSETLKFNNISDLIDNYYKHTSISDSLSQKISSLQKYTKIVLNRDINKLSKLKEEKVISDDRDKYKIWADLISANSHLIKKGQKILIAENFYDAELNKITIQLDETKSPWENAQYYYKKYSKLKTSSKLLENQIPKLESEISYIEQIIDSFRHISTNAEVEEIRTELEENNYIRKRKKKKRKEKPSKPMHYISRNGADIYVGKNNFQNDYLTLKLANKEDYFIHAKNVPGSHVILRNNNIDKNDIQDACNLAAYYSSLSNDDQVSVDYTFKKNVHKSKGAKPGMVYYDNFKTTIVDLKNFDINELLKKEK